MEPPATLDVGTKLKDRYRIDALLDRGDMGSVWRGQDEVLGRPVVVKIPHREHLDVPGFLERFEREVKRLVALQHSHIVPIYDAGRFEGTPYAVLAFLTGGNLARRVENRGLGEPKRLPAHDLRTWLADVAGALDFIHAQRVIHRDVKPANILFDGDGRAHVSDFGISKSLTGENSLTPSECMVGTPSYVPPEAIRLEVESSPPSGRFDQYSLATVVYEVVSGYLPFSSGSVATVLLRKAREKPASLGRIAPGTPASLVAAVDRALSIAPEDRYDSCGGFAAAARGW